MQSRFFISNTTTAQFEKMLLQTFLFFLCNYFSLICGSDVRGAGLKNELGDCVIIRVPFGEAKVEFRFATLGLLSECQMLPLCLCY